MNKHYTEIAEVVLPAHENEESLTTLHIFDVDDEKALDLYDLYADAEETERAILEDLNAQDDYGVMPGAPFHRFSAEFSYPHTVYLYDTLAYNV